MVYIDRKLQHLIMVSPTRVLLAGLCSLLLFVSLCEGKRRVSQYHEHHRQIASASHAGHPAGKVRVKALVAVMVRHFSLLSFCP